jgi:1-acyl-sn-glycerol-3-phosphate acyltransferase
VPVMGTAFRMVQFVSVDRSNRAAALASVEQAKRYIRAGMSYVVFPEGTRSPDGRLMKFKTGSIALAMETGAQIVPVSVIGTQHLMPRGHFLIQPGEVRVVFHPAIPTSGYSLAERHALTSRIFDVVCSALPPEQQPLQEVGVP